MIQAGERVEKYVVEALLGEGGMATVYRVRHEALGTLHALKLLGNVPRAVSRRIELEGQVQGSLKHPNIVAVTDLVHHQGQPALVMELVEGPSLSALVRGRPLGLAQVDVLARRILAAMAHAHARGFVHRDLKPGNVLIEVRGDDLVPKVADFGLAKVLDAEDDGSVRTRTGSAMGTPAYMAPEQIRNSKDVDARADVYSLGVLLYELISGRRPYAGDQLVELHEQASRGGFVPLGQLVPGLPGRVVDGVGAALDPDRERRPADAGALLERWTAGTTEIAARPAELWGPLLEAARALADEQATETSGRLEPRSSSATLASFSEPSTVPVVPPPAVRTRTRRTVVQVTGLALVVLLAIGITSTGGYTLFLTRGSAEPETAPPPIDRVPASGGVAPITVAPPVDGRAKQEDPMSAVSPRPAAAGPTGSFAVLGGVDAVLVRGSERYRPPDPVPAGRYQVWAAFDGTEAFSGLEVEVGAGAAVRIECSLLHRRCAVVP